MTLEHQGIGGDDPLGIQLISASVHMVTPYTLPRILPTSDHVALYYLVLKEIHI